MPISKTNVSTIICNTNASINNINKYLQESNSNTITDFIWLKNYKVTIITNQATSFQDINTIKKYTKDSENINSEYIKKPRLSKNHT